MILCERIGLLFVQVPQTGSTAIGAELCEFYGGEPILVKHAGIERAYPQLDVDLDRYVIVSGIRNPLDQAVSSYFKALSTKATTRPQRSPVNWITQTSTARQRSWFAQLDGVTFSDYFLQFYRWVSAPRWLASQRASDVVIRFESIQHGFTEALSVAGVSQVRLLPLVNKTGRRPESSFYTYYDDRAQERARWVFGPYMEEWGYSFPSSWSRQSQGLSRPMSNALYGLVPRLKRARSSARRLLGSRSSGLRPQR